MKLWEPPNEDPKAKKPKVSFVAFAMRWLNVIAAVTATLCGAGFWLTVQGSSHTVHFSPMTASRPGCRWSWSGLFSPQDWGSPASPTSCSQPATAISASNRVSQQLTTPSSKFGAQPPVLFAHGTTDSSTLIIARQQTPMENTAWYLLLLGTIFGSAALSLRASRRADKHRQLAMAATTSVKQGPGYITFRSPVHLQAAPSAAAMTTGTPVAAKTMLVVGATGTLGRQIVRVALDAGYDVRCLVRPRQNPADFLRDWGAKTVNGNLASPKTLPAALVGVHTVVDVATARPEESIREVDWEGKKALIQAAKAMGIQRYIFFSIIDCDKSPDVPLMDIKHCTEEYIKQVGLKYTILRMCGFMQALIQQYAVPMLEGEEVFGTRDDTHIAYLSTQDAARMTIACLQHDSTIGKTLTLAGPKAYSVKEVIALCEKLGGMEAKVKDVPVGVLGALRNVTSLFSWTKEVSDRLAFSELLSNNKEFSAPMDETYRMLGLDPNDTQTLESYLNEYYKRILARLKELKAKSGQKGILL
eukprot:EG_transcript_4868